MSIKQFGCSPDAGRKRQYSTLPNYKNGQFQNQLPTPALAEGESMTRVLLDFVKKHPYTEPRHTLPFVKTDLKNLSTETNVLVWFGHSSYFIQLHGRKYLADPVFSGNASPIPGSVKAFAGSNVYQADDLPEIDILFISHDHWDHLDYETIGQLKNKVKQVVCGLGVGQHFEYWGWDKNRLTERNWYESIEPEKDLKITLMPARHFSGRLFRRNISLWTSFVLESKTKKIFLGGDSGYGPHFAEIGERFGPFDLAILECGQYNEKWPYIHSLPQELVTEARELKAACFLPVHHSKFKLAQHPWFEPLQQVREAAEKAGIPVITPQIGEPVNLDRLDTVFSRWWENV
ncbi:MAG: MBL fold metallo-hydrolase [Flavihumibacter sp.]